MAILLGLMCENLGFQKRSEQKHGAIGWPRDKMKRPHVVGFINRPMMCSEMGHDFQVLKKGKPKGTRNPSKVLSREHAVAQGREVAKGPAKIGGQN